VHRRCRQAGERLNLDILDNPGVCADRLADIARYFGFDGWLINIEAPLPKSRVTDMISFVSAPRGSMSFVPSLSSVAVDAMVTVARR
jgi:endo-beta-N-acetylglucosaminidase D